MVDLHFRRLIVTFSEDSIEYRQPYIRHANGSDPHRAHPPVARPVARRYEARRVTAVARALRLLPDADADRRRPGG